MPGSRRRPPMAAPPARRAAPALPRSPPRLAPSCAWSIPFPHDAALRPGRWRRRCPQHNAARCARTGANAPQRGKMRLAVYHPWTYLRGGIERVLTELLGRSRHEWTLFTHHYEPEATFPELSGCDVVELRPGVSVERRLAPIVGATWRIARTRLPVDGHRGLLVSCDGLGDLVLARSKLPAVCYCHTPLKIRHDPVAQEGLRERSPVQHRL